MAPKDITEQNEEFEYVGFWPRLGATIIDSILLSMIVYPLLYTIYGNQYFTDERFISGGGDFMVSYVLPAIAIIAFWIYRSATPGKMAIRATIVDAKTCLAAIQRSIDRQVFCLLSFSNTFRFGVFMDCLGPQKTGLA